VVDSPRDLALGVVADGWGDVEVAAVDEQFHQSCGRRRRTEVDRRGWGAEPSLRVNPR
jgi:hypothetical protein